MSQTSQVENLLASKYFWWSRNCVDCQHVVTVQCFPISGSQKSYIEILVFEIFILFCPSFCPRHPEAIFVLSIFRPQHSRLSFNKTHLCRVCFVFKLLGRHAIKHILHWVRFVFKITGRQLANNCFPCRLHVSPLTKINVISPLK